MRISIPRYLVYAVILIVICLVFFVPIFPSVDGAAHLYNSLIFKDLFMDLPSAYNKVFTYNKIIVPNWFDHIFIAGLSFLFSALLAQKIFVVITIVSFTHAYFKVGSGNDILTLLILPFIFSFFLITGLYNQTWSFIVFLYFLSFLDRNNFKVKREFKFWLIIFVYAMLFWITSVLGYGLFLVLLGITLFNQKKLSKVIRDAVITVFLISPSFILTIYFVANTSMSNGEPVIGVFSRIINLLLLDSLKFSGMGGEPIFLGIVSISVIILLVLVLRNNKNVGLYVLIGCVLLLFAIATPNHVGAGMLSNRLAFYFWLFVLFFIKKFSSNVKLNSWFSAIVLICFVLTMNKRYNTHFEKYGELSKEIYDIGIGIETGKSVWSVNYSDEWFVGHSLNYACIPNKAIAIDNYEANYAWFPIRWRNEYRFLGQQYKNLWVAHSLTNFTNVSTDYILTYGTIPKPVKEELLKSYYVIDRNERLILLAKKD